ncbi:MAG: N-6 DNA methylase, partial [bacterium]|nr:N-6 DNA methylase [bacterium]
KFRNRSNEILFIDARKLGEMTNRRNRKLTEADIALVASTYHNWRNKDPKGLPRHEDSPIKQSDKVSFAPDLSKRPLGSVYQDVAGFCKAATLEEVRNNNYVLMPGRYVGAEEVEDDGIPFDEKMNALTTKLAEQFTKGAKLEKTIRENLKGIGYEF